MVSTFWCGWRQNRKNDRRLARKDRAEEEKEKAEKEKAKAEVERTMAEQSILSSARRMADQSRVVQEG